MSLIKNINSPWLEEVRVNSHEYKVEQYLKHPSLARQYINNRFYAMQMWIDYLIKFRLEQRIFEEECAEELHKWHFIATGRIFRWSSQYFSFTTTLQIKNQKPMSCEEFTAWISIENPKLPL